MVTNNSANYQPTQYAVQIGGANGTLANVALGSATQVLTSNGAGAAPTFQNAGGSSSCSFAALLSSAVSNATGDGTNYFIIFDSVLSNIGSNYDNTTGIFTAPATGTYQFNVTIYFNLLTSSHTLTQCYLYNDTNVAVQNILSYCNPFVCGNGTQFVVKGSGILDLTASDQVSVLAQVSGGAKTVEIYGAATVQQTSFSGFRVA